MASQKKVQTNLSELIVMTIILLTQFIAIDMMIRCAKKAIYYRLS